MRRRIDLISMSLILLFLLSSASLATDLQNAYCDFAGSWSCVEQGPLQCARTKFDTGQCKGTCKLSWGPEIPTKVCFVREGATCPNPQPFSCGPYYGGHCVHVEEYLPYKCGCNPDDGVPDGYAIYPSC